jgi:TfoX/Sxy family transcriptional regulator of competence genes
MHIPKPTDADKASFRSVVPGDPRVEVKPMFGNLGAFVNGNMFMGLFGSDIGLRLAPQDKAEMEGIDGAGPFGPADRPMSGYVSLPASMRDTPAASSWARRAFEYAAELPPKVPKAR